MIIDCDQLDWLWSTWLIVIIGVIDLIGGDWLDWWWSLTCLEVVDAVAGFVVNKTFM